VNAARTRIGRVKMKNGGADVRVIYQETAPNPVSIHLRAWTKSVTNQKVPPDAYAAVAFWFDPATPGRPGYNIAYISKHAAIPTALLVRMAAAYIVTEHAVNCAVSRTIEEMGGVPEDWTPDDGA